MDTGFSGFLLVPVSMALTLDLVPYASIDVILADGTTQSKLICDGAATFEQTTREGLIVLEEHGTEVLAGIEFLKVFALTLTLNAKSMIFVLTLP